MNQLNKQPDVPGCLVVLEGCDGVGKTTQARRLVEVVTQLGRTAHLTCQPSSFPTGRRIRSILKGDDEVCWATLALLFAADRMEHVRREVKPALEAAHVVISDRWYHSSLAYQGYGRGWAWVAGLNTRVRRPDLTIVLVTQTEVAARRRTIAGRPPEMFDDLEEQGRVAEGYDQVVQRLCREERIVTIDGDQDEDAVAEHVELLVREVL